MDIGRVHKVGALLFVEVVKIREVLEVVGVHFAAVDHLVRLDIVGEFHDLERDTEVGKDRFGNFQNLCVRRGRRGHGDLGALERVVIDARIHTVARIFYHRDHSAVIVRGDVIGDRLALERSNQRFDGILGLVAVLDGDDVRIRAVRAFNQKAFLRRLHTRGNGVVRVDHRVIHVGQDGRNLGRFHFLKGDVQRVFHDIVDRGGDAGAVFELDDAVFLQKNQRTRFVGRVVRHGNGECVFAAAGCKRKHADGQNGECQKDGQCSFHGKYPFRFS